MTQGPEILEWEERQRRWDQRMMLLSIHVAGWSKDPSTKVGAVICDDEYRVLALGYNGFPRGVEDNAARYDDRAAKYPRVVHAELNAILNTGVPMSLEDATLFCSLPPCCECAKAIIQSGITRVVTSATQAGADRWSDSWDIALDMFVEAGVEVCLV